MGEITEFPLSTRLFLRAYPWRRVDPVPWTPLRRPLAESRLALISSAGFVLPGQDPFDAEYRGGDPSFREIPADCDVSTLIDTQRSGTFDHSPMRTDPNLAFPIDRVHELVERGRLGSVSRCHFSFSGSITAPGRLVRQTALAVAGRLAADAVDVALLVPV